MDSVELEELPHKIKIFASILQWESEIKNRKSKLKNTGNFWSYTFRNYLVDTAEIVHFVSLAILQLLLTTPETVEAKQKLSAIWNEI